jgi:hypothetical protein
VLRCVGLADDSPTAPDPKHEWLVRHERLWRRAHSIVRDRPDLDASGVYHALCNLERTPEERLRRGLLGGRLRSD